MPKTPQHETTAPPLRHHFTFYINFLRTKDRYPGPLLQVRQVQYLKAG